MAWKVPIVMREAARRPRRSSSRWRISAAAWLVKVTAVISPGRTPRSSTSHAIRSTRVLVLPVPGPATTATVRSSAEMAACCWELERWRPCSPSRSAAFGRFGSCPRFFSPCFGVSSAPNRETCPLRRWISAGARREMAPYSPSNPGRRSTCPSRRRRMPSATQGPASRCRSSMGTSRRIVNSGPRVCSKRSYCSRVFFPAAEPPVEAAITSGRGARLSKGLASSGRKPAPPPGAPPRWSAFSRTPDTVRPVPPSRRG